MTGRDPDATGSQAPAAPARPTRPQGWVGDDATSVLARWMVTHAGSYTPAALDRAASAAGYTDQQVVDARQRADVRIRKTARLRPVRRSAWRGVLLAYGVVWLALVVSLLAERPETWLYDTQLLVVVLSASMAIALAVSLAAVRQGDPDPERPARAVALLLALPTLLLLAIAGLCLPTVVS